MKKKDYKVNAAKLTKPLKQVWKYYKPLLKKAFVSKWATNVNMAECNLIHAHSLKHIDVSSESDEDKMKKIRSLTDISMYNFDLFFPIPPYYALMLGGKIRKFLCKMVAHSKGTVDIRPYIRPDLDEKLGILIEYRIL